jgi:hypothetical protein
MPNWIDIAVPVLVFITLVWGFTTGYWYALVLLIALLIGIVVGARFDIGAATQVQRLLTTTSTPLIQALMFVIVTIIATAVAAGIVGWLLGFARPETRAARGLPSSHLFGGLFGLGFGAVLASVLLMAAYLGSSDLSAQQVPGTAALRTTIERSSVSPGIWRLVHLEERGLKPVLGAGTRPPFNVP